MFKLTQTSSVTEYYDKFIDLANRSYGMDDTQLLDCLIGGLRPNLKKEVMSRYPHSLMQAVDLAKLFVEKFFPTPAPCYRTRPLYNQPKLIIPAPLKAIPLTTPLPSTHPNTTPLLPTPPKPPSLRKLTLADVQFRREKAYVLLVMIVTHQPTIAPTNTKPRRRLKRLSNKPIHLHLNYMHPRTKSIILSYHVLKGITGLGTIHFTGMINGHEVQILVDGESSDNFIQLGIATFLKLPCSPLPTSES